jgi:Bacterial sugar transferase
MRSIVYSSLSIGDPHEGNIAGNRAVSAERPAGSSRRFSERRILLQDYSFAFILLDSATIVVGGIVLSYLFSLRDLPSIAGWANPSLIIVSIFYLLASIGFRIYSSSVPLDRRNMIRCLFLALGATFGLFLVLAEMTNTMRDYSRPGFFLWALVSSLLIATIRSTAQAYGRHSLQNGAFLDKSDELPQFINVLQGAMSVVGPRPPALQTHTNGKNLKELIAHYAGPHRVKPGITAWAEVRGRL